MAEQIQAVNPLPDAPEYDHDAVERRWQEAWAENGVFRTPHLEEGESGTYVHAANPFTSGRAHLGHVRSYTIADAHARFRRARGDKVLFTVGFDALGLPTEVEAIERGLHPGDWAEECRTQMREQFDSLGHSFDWDRSFITTDPQIFKWSQYLFLLLLEHGHLYPRTATVDWCGECQTVLARAQIEDGACWRCGTEPELTSRRQWFLRTSAYLEEEDQRLEELDRWDKSSIGSQRSLLGRTEGVELDASISGGPPIAVFTPHVNDVAKAEFVAISPNHPRIGELIQDEGVKGHLKKLRGGGWVRSDRSADAVPIVETLIHATVPGIQRTLPVIVTPSVDSRFGATAILGVPEADKTDMAIGSRLSPASSLKVSVRSADPRPAVRYSAGDYPVSRQRAWGSPIPVVHCESCGVVPVTPEELPIELPGGLVFTGSGNPLTERPDFLAVDCPSCGRPASRETDTLDCHFDSLWMWFAPCVPAEERPVGMFDSVGLRQWLPVVQVVWGIDGSTHLASQRNAAKMLRDAGVFAHIEDGEPFQRVMFHDMVLQDGRKMSKHLSNVVSPDEILVRFGADTLRLAMLYAAAPRNGFYWDENDLRTCQRFHLRLWSYSWPRLRATAEAPVGQVDESDKLRRLLLRWVNTATRKVSADLEELQTHRSARNVILLLTRIEDFEARALHRRGELASEDWQVLTWALRRLIQLLAPMSPHISEELWRLGGGEEWLAEQPWPNPDGGHPPAHLNGARRDG